MHLSAVAALRYAVRERIDAAKLGMTGSCHMFRHTMAMLMHENSADNRVSKTVNGVTTQYLVEDDNNPTGLPQVVRGQAIEGVKLPKNLRAKTVTFRELCEDALAHSRHENSEKQTYELGLRIEQLLPICGPRQAASIRKNEIVSWLGEQAEKRDWAPTTRNRWEATFSLIYRVGMDNEKIEANPAARIRRKTEGSGRVRFLSDTEEKRLRIAI